MIGFFVFNIKGVSNSFKSIRDKEEKSGIHKASILGNFTLFLLPLSLILIVVLQIIGIDIFGIMPTSTY